MGAGAGGEAGGLSVIRGAEFSTVALVDGRPVSVHVLGYLFDPDAPAIIAEHIRLREERLQRGMAIVRKMVDAGLPISTEQVMTIADGAPIGRPHIGQALVASGVVASVDEAFATYLAGNGRFYVRKADTDLPTAVRMITAAGGVSVIAHPRGRGEYRALSFDYIAMLAAQGLGGLEVDHPNHGPAERAELQFDRRSVGASRDRIVGLSRAQQAVAARSGDDPAGDPGGDRRAQQRRDLSGRSGRLRSVTGSRTRLLDALAGLLAAGLLVIGLVLLLAVLIAPDGVAGSGTRPRRRPRMVQCAGASRGRAAWASWWSALRDRWPAGVRAAADAAVIAAVLAVLWWHWWP